MLWITLLVSSLPCSLPNGKVEGTGPDFAAEVRPILAKYCFKCHGPDELTRKAKLRLDLRDAALAPARSGERAIVPGKPDESELVARLDADGDRRMPPPATKLELDDKQKEILKKWIAAGAEYKPHWAFQPIARPAVPTVRDQAWVKTPIDAFILARLEAKNIRPSPVADARTLARRVSYDLTGLPPDPGEVELFAANPTEEAYQAFVDKLLASPRYGERWARPWLDLARYADTNGYEKDRPRGIWPWRDWVVKALNEDMPFDKFTLMQLAGDQLPGAGQEGIIATGFHRNTMINEEGGIDPLEFRFHAMTDRVGTTGTTWLGLTLACAQCHTHKYDPITQAEYYKLMAFMDNAEEYEAPVPTPEQQKLARELEEQIRALEKGLPLKFMGDYEKGLGAWADKVKAQADDWKIVQPVKASSNEPKLRLPGNGIVLAEGDTTKVDIFDLQYGEEAGGVRAFRLEALPDPMLPAGGPGMAWYEGPKGDFCLEDLQIVWDGQPVKLVKATQTHAKGGYEAAKAIDTEGQTGWSTGLTGQRSVAVFYPEKPLPPAKSWSVRMAFGRHYPATLGKLRWAVTRQEREPTAKEMSDEAERALLRRPNLEPGDKEALSAEFNRVAPELAEARKAVEALRAKLPKPPTTLAMRERQPDNPRVTRIRHRGEYLSPKDPVQPAVPGFLPPLPPDAGKGRLGFAQWLVSRDNPLTARVVVNRQWAALMGQGIVRTVDDFGLQGELPSHPDLLDWLAGWMQDNGWSLKKLHRLIVLSSVYRQSSNPREDLATMDPENRLCARGARHRLDAEMIRDGMLQAAGLLSTKMGGPGVYPPQPASITTEGTYGPLTWNPSTGEDRYRRSLYTFAKRTAPFAQALTFDAPSGEACVAKRDRSNSPLQALLLLNDPAMLEAARGLADTLLRRSQLNPDPISYAFARVLSRPPTPEELADLTEFVSKQEARFQAKPEQARALLGLDAKENVQQSLLTKRAAYTALARLLFNLDEAVVKR